MNDLAISPDGKRLAAACAEKTWCVWDLADGRCRTFRPYWNGPLSVAFSPDSRLCLTGEEFNVYAWDAATGARLSPDPLQRHRRPGGVSGRQSAPRLRRPGRSPRKRSRCTCWASGRTAPDLLTFPPSPASPGGSRSRRTARRAFVAGQDGVVRGVEPGGPERPARVPGRRHAPVGGFTVPGPRAGRLRLRRRRPSTRGTSPARSATPPPFRCGSRRSCLAASSDGSRLVLGSQAGSVDALDAKTSRHRAVSPAAGERRAGGRPLRPTSPSC